MDEGETPDVVAQKTGEQSSLSYKFQRLREKLREAISTGELQGKLPGERALAKRFHVNAKTLSKALTDLAAEGLLDRSIGRGTFVKGSEPAGTSDKRWLIVCDPEQVRSEIVHLLCQAHPNSELLSDFSKVRPSFLNQFSAVIVMTHAVPDTFIRDLVVRNMGVVLVGREPKTYSTHAVIFDSPLAVSLAARDLMLGGHHRIASVEARQSTLVADTLRQSAGRYCPQAVIDACYPGDAGTMVHNGVTAFVCHSIELAAEVQAELARCGIAVPQQVSVIAVGSAPESQPVSGYYISRSEKTQAVVQLLKQSGTRPTTIWLASQFVDRGTTASVTIQDPTMAKADHFHHAANAHLP